jgi:hypothetical protein
LLDNTEGGACVAPPSVFSEKITPPARLDRLLSDTMEWDPPGRLPERMEEMRHIVVVGVLLALVGCTNFVGPFQPRSPQRIDDPRVSLPEQERRQRAQLAMPDSSWRTLPPLNSGDPNAFIQEH